MGVTKCTQGGGCCITRTVPCRWALPCTLLVSLVEIIGQWGPGVVAGRIYIVIIPSPPHDATPPGLPSCEKYLSTLISSCPSRLQRLSLIVVNIASRPHTVFPSSRLSLPLRLDLYISPGQMLRRLRHIFLFASFCSTFPVLVSYDLTLATYIIPREFHPTKKFRCATAAPFVDLAFHFSHHFSSLPYVARTRLSTDA